MKASSLEDKLGQKLSRREVPTSVDGDAIPKPASRIGRRITSISLYEPDRSRIRAIQHAVEDAGAGRIDDSKAIRLALRAVETNSSALLTALDSLRADDGRQVKG
jgi:hypothetical protein